MPKHGQKTITVRQDTYEIAKLKADQQNKSFAHFVTDKIVGKKVKEDY